MILIARYLGKKLGKYLYKNKNKWSRQGKVDDQTRKPQAHCSIFCAVLYLKSQHNGYSTMKVADSMWCWAVGRAGDLTMLPR